MGKKEEKTRLLIHLFKTNGALSREEIHAELDINDRSVKGYISDLRSLGYNIETVQGAYHLCENAAVKGDGVLLSAEDIRQLAVIKLVSECEGDLTRQTLLEHLTELLCDDDALSRKSLERAIGACLRNQYVYTDTLGHFFVSNSAETLVGINVKELDRFIELCSAYQENLPFGEEISALERKLIALTGDQVLEYKVHTLGRQYMSKASSEAYIRFFKTDLYKQQELSCTYNSRVGWLEKRIKIVSLVYYQETDRIYAAAYEGENLIFIGIDTISSLLETGIPNDRYQDPEALHKLSSMFGCSLDGPHSVRVRFPNKPYIRTKLERLKTQNSGFRIELRENALIFEAVLYGLSDFARYLRCFGPNCEALAPEELRDMMQKSYDRLLNRYNEVT